LPSDEELEALVDSQGTNPGSKLAGGTNWKVLDATGIWKKGPIIRPEFGSSGFDVQPLGSRNPLLGDYHSRGLISSIRSSSQAGALIAWLQSFDHALTVVMRNSPLKTVGVAVRCVQD
jgi:hypothetical protein